MTTWLTAPGTYHQRYAEVRELCRTNFGPEHKISHNKGTGAKFDNHGNWSMNGVLKFRYLKDLSWFMLAGLHLQDVTPWPWER